MNRSFTYFVYGDYGYVTETELFSSKNQQEAIEWLKDYVGDGDTGGYDVLEVAYHDQSGEYHTVYTFEKADFEDEDNLIDEW